MVRRPLRVFVLTRRTTLLWRLLASFCCLVQGRRLALLTGSTGTLGRALAKALLSQQGHEETLVCLGHRDPGKLDSLLCSLDKDPRALPFLHGDMSSLTDVSAATEALSAVVGDLRTFESVLLLNNAGVCLAGSSLQTLETSIRVNAMAPVVLARYLLGCLSLLQPHPPRLRVVNVSSGDGQLVYLDSTLSREVAGLDSLVEWHSFCEALIRDATSTLHARQLAHGDTPAYSVSKALLNRGAWLLHREAAASVASCSVVSVCPGNFQSPMSTPEEAEDSVSAADAAEGVLQMCRHAVPDSTPGGFYRFGRPIEF